MLIFDDLFGLFLKIKLLSLADVFNLDFPALRIHKLTYYSDCLDMNSIYLTYIFNGQSYEVGDKTGLDEVPKFELVLDEDEYI